MSFKTKLDYSNNRQIKQNEKTITTFSGGTVFGIPFSGLSIGPDLSTSGIIEDFSDLSGTTFSGNASTTIFNWVDSRMNLVNEFVIPITPSNSGVTQTFENVFVSSETTSIDGNEVNTFYTGVTLSFLVDEMTINGSNYTGTVFHEEFDVLSASPIDYQGRTIWVDNPEISRTDRLIIKNNASPGRVFTCLDNEGMGQWIDVNISGGTDIYWELGGSGDFSIKARNRGLSDVNGDYGVTIGFDSVVEGEYAFASGSGTTASGDISNADGFGTIASGYCATSKGINTQANGAASNAEGSNTQANGTYSHAQGNSTQANGDNSHAQGSGTQANGIVSHAQGVNSQANGYGSHAQGLSTKANGYGSHAQGENTIASGDLSFSSGHDTIASGYGSFVGGIGLNPANNIVSSGDVSFTFQGQVKGGMYGSFADYSAVLGGADNVVFSSSTYSAILGGFDNSILSGTTGTVIIGGESIVASRSETVYVPDLIIDDLTNVTDLRTNADGLLVNNSISDLKFKKNINPISNALSKILELSGVSFNWKEEVKFEDDLQFGFIAQDVLPIIPDIIKQRNDNGEYLTMDYKYLIPWLVEAIKDIISIGVVELNTQTITSEDNFIELNYNGNHFTANNGGISIVKGIDENTNSDLKINSEGHFYTNTYLKPNGLVIPHKTIINSNDSYGIENEMVADDDYLYIKKNNKWLRTKLEEF